MRPTDRNTIHWQHQSERPQSEAAALSGIIPNLVYQCAWPNIQKSNSWGIFAPRNCKTAIAPVAGHAKRGAGMRFGCSAWGTRLARLRNWSGSIATGCANSSNTTMRLVPRRCRITHPQRPKGPAPALPDPDQQALQAVLTQRPPDGGIWTSSKVAAWIASRTGRDHIHPQLGWVYLRKLGQTCQISPGSAQVMSVDLPRSILGNAAQPPS